MAYCHFSIRNANLRSPLRLRTAVTHTQPARPSQTRTLWWWGRNSYPHLDEGAEERFLRSQRITRHRYAKIVRRRAMWDRESFSNQWLWHRSGRPLDQQTRSVQDSDRSRPCGSLTQEKVDETEQQNSSVSFHKDFDSFRRAVDRAMERDPYGTLFGRRLWSPPSPNNMSWTSFSWFADPPKEMKEHHAADTQPPRTPNSAAATNGSVESSAKNDSQHTGVSSDPSSLGTAASVHYIYDPISGRKVPDAMKQPATQTQADGNNSGGSPTPHQAPNAPRKSIFDTLFGENAVDIPVKTYESKVYGYKGQDSPKDESNSTKAVKSKSGFENSRRREFLALKAVKLGNTIDTTAEYGGKYKDPTEPPPINVTPSAEPSSDAPLFSGTTYESRAAGILRDNKSSSWLQKEGFGEAVDKSTEPVGASASNSKMIQPAIDRLQSIAPGKTDKLQPSLNRSSRPIRHTSSPSEFKSTAAWQAKVDAAEKAEDIDLLRTSDIRAGMKSKRQTKQDIEEQKRQVRQSLEKAFTAKQAEDAGIAKPTVPSGLHHLRKHVESNPDGIVARTIGTLNGTFQKYLRTSEAPEEMSRVEGNQDLPRSSLHAAHATRLQQSAETPISAVETTKPHPLSEATVKEGVRRYPVIEDHVSKFEPRYADLVFRMKNVRRELHHSKLQLRHLRSVLQRKPWNELEAERLDEYARSPSVEEDASASGFDEPIFNSESKNSAPQPQAIAAASQDQEMSPSKRDTAPRSLDEPITSYQQKQSADTSRSSHGTPESLPRMEAPVSTPAGSPVWNDEQPPSIAELRSSESKEFTSPFVMLINNGGNGIRAVPAPNLPHLAGRKKISPFEIMVRLDQDKAAEYLAYFPRLWGAGYELVNADTNKLIFRRLPTSVPHDTVSRGRDPDKTAATVLDEIPAEIEPPGPSAPIAPPSSATRLFDRQPKSQQPIRRQEEVFSGTTTAPARIVAPSDRQPANSPPVLNSSYNSDARTPEPGLFVKVTRALRRITLAVIALAGGAYAVGFISEGIGAQTQAQRGLAGETGGPRKRIVLPVEDSDKWRRGTRPGIYSTESSR